MQRFEDTRCRVLRLSDERLDHLESQHPEMAGQLERIANTLADPDRIIRSRTDTTVELFYKYYASTPVSMKFLCIVVKKSRDDNFIVTAYYTDSVKKGELLWEKK
ncbi:MAG: PBECR2 nuclease fold domain-containing protein [Pseudomonadota bacterium]